MRKLIAPLVGIMFATVTTSYAADAAAQKLNVLLLVADDFQVQLGRYRSAAKTPNLDRLAARGMLFDHAYCQQALCNPSRSSFLCGLRPDTIGLWSNSVHFRDRLPDVVTLPQAFLAAGYTTRNCGKIFHNWHTKVHGDPKSWSAPEFLHYESHGHDQAVVDGEPPPNLAKTLTGRKYTDVPLVERRDVPDQAYFDGRVADEAVHVLNEIKDQPFFLAVGFWKPHAPFNAPAKYWDLYDRSLLPEADGEFPRDAPTVAHHDGRELRGVPPDRITFNVEQIAEIRHGYYANISYMDAQVGKVLDALEKSGVAERTIVLFFADHGYHVGEHGLWGKTSCFELDARVPLIIATPNLAERGARAAGLVELIDIYPTLTELCGVPGPKNLEGKSLKPMLADPQASVKQMAFTQHPRPAYYDRTPKGVPDAMGYSVRTVKVRYTEWRDPVTENVLHQELYDHETDPFETRNVAGSPPNHFDFQQAQRLLRTLLPGTVDPPATHEEEKQLERRYDVDEIRREFPVKAGMTVDEVYEVQRRQTSLANPRRNDEPYSLDSEKHSLNDGNGWIYFRCSQKHDLHCDLAVENGRIKNVWVAPGGFNSPPDVYFRLSGSGTHEVHGFRQKDESIIRTDQDLTAIQKPAGIDFLDLRRDEVTDRSLEQLHRFSNLRRLVLSNTAATDGGLAHLKQLPRLRELTVSMRDWSDASLAQLAELTQLELLIIAPNAKQIEALLLDVLVRVAAAESGEKVPPRVLPDNFTAAGLTKLRSLSNLKILDLSNSPITDETLRPLTELAQLEELSLRVCDGISDAAIPTLAKMKRLKGIDLSHTGVTEAGANELRKQLPDCRVHFESLRRSRP